MPGFLFGLIGKQGAEDPYAMPKSAEPSGGSALFGFGI